MSDFTVKHEVNRPRKPHHCYLCNGDIAGAHIRIDGVFDGRFFSQRVHKECEDAANTMCSECEFNSDCLNDLRECFAEECSEMISQEADPC